LNVGKMSLFDENPCVLGRTKGLLRSAIPPSALAGGSPSLPAMAAAPAHRRPPPAPSPTSGAWPHGHHGSPPPPPGSRAPPSLLHQPPRMWPGCPPHKTSHRLLPRHHYGARLAVRARALQWHLHPNGARRRRAQPSLVSPCDDLNGFQYPPN